jgi:tetratricopeptide (TPR) repeat protein
MRYLAACPALLAAGACAAVPAGAYAAAPAGAPQVGQEYVSVQIASGEAQALEALYARHAALPYLRIEKRGAAHVLRAGFWDSAKQARNAIAGAGLAEPLIRNAAYLPAQIVRSNWSQEKHGVQANAAAQASAPATMLTPVALAVAGSSEQLPPTSAMPERPGSSDAPRLLLASALTPPDSPLLATPVALRPQATDRATAPTAPAAPAPPPEPALPAPPAAAPQAAPRSGDHGAASRAAAIADQEELLPFNQEDFSLAFDIFVGAGDLKRGFRVAEKAVQSVPEDLEWRLKLARVAEWTQRPLVAFAQREYLFRRGDRSDETLTALLRLAPVAPNLDTVLAVWEVKADRGPLTPKQWDDLQQLFDAAARPRQGSQYFEAQYRKRRDPELLSRAGLLAENAGDDERAYRLYAERLELAPFRVDLALRAAIYLLRNDRNREAFALMQKHRGAVPADAVDFWRILGNTAWELAEHAAAEEAYRKFLGSGKPQAADFSRLINLVRQRHPGEAARLAVEVYRRFGNIDYLVLALNIHGDARDIAGQGRVFAGLSDAERTGAEQDLRFIVLRAQYYQLAGKPELAWDDFRAALGRGVTDSSVTVPALWFLIETQRSAELTALLQRLAPLAQEDAAYWMPYAAAYHALDRYREAIYWYRKEIARGPEDTLTLLNYADCLDRYQLTGMADRVRQHAWLALNEKTRGLGPDERKAPFDANPELLAFVRLAIQNRPGDPALAIVRDVAAQLRGLPAVGASDRETRTLILSWAVSAGQFENARAWMWLRYARSAAARVAAQQEFDPAGAAARAAGAGEAAMQTAGTSDAAMQTSSDGVPDPRGEPPLWGQAQTALQLNDTQGMDRMLTRRASGLPIYNRYDIAYALEHWQQALDIAFRGMEKNPVDEDLHDRFRQHAPLHTSYVQAMFTRDAYGDLDSRSQQVEAGWWMFRKLLVRVGYTRVVQSSANEDIGPLIPSTDRLGSLRLRWIRNNDATTSLDLFRRSEAAALNGWRLAQTLRVDHRISLDGAIEQRGSTTESIPLRVAGYANNLRAGLTWTIGKREYLRVGAGLDRYYTQFNDYLGRARRFDLDAGYRIRTEYPDWKVRVFIARQLVTRDGSVGADTVARLPQSIRDQVASGDLEATRYFLPDGSTTLGVCFGAGENLAGANLQETYTRAWRPFYEACKQDNSLNGSGYIATLGMAGSLIGPDHLSLRFDISRGGSGAGALARTLALRYRYYF